MNTLALNYNCSVEPWWNFDYETGVNFYSSRSIESYLRQVHCRFIPNILKTHHHLSFFQNILDYLTDQFHVFYIYRDPRDVMCSFWRMLNGLAWNEGPKTKSVSDFMRSEPCGGLLRYQTIQASNMLQRWRQHVEGWLSAAEQREEQIFVVRYEALNKNFIQTVSSISQHLGYPSENIHRPARGKNVVAAGRGQSGSYARMFSQGDYEFVENEIGEVLNRLNYSERWNVKKSESGNCE